MLTFYCIGAQKCGTTWLYSHLNAHPQLALPARKEQHFWDADYPAGKSVEGYKARFSLKKKEGDMTPAYAILTPDVIRACHKHFPDLRLVFMIRDPFERMWSAVRAEVRKNALDPATLPDSFYTGFFNRPDTIARSDYRACMDNWLSVYPSKQLLVLDHDMLVHEPARLLARVCDHLGIERLALPEEQLKQKIYEGLALPDALWERLLPYMRAHYTELAERYRELAAELKRAA